MELWRVALDWMLIITSTYVLFRTYNRIMMERDVSLGNYVFLVFWIFYCLPIALDYVIGRPQYETVYWYQPFIVCMSNDYVSALYDMVILVAVLVIYFYCNRYQKSQCEVSSGVDLCLRAKVFCFSLYFFRFSTSYCPGMFRAICIMATLFLEEWLKTAPA